MSLRADALHSTPRGTQRDPDDLHHGLLEAVPRKAVPRALWVVLAVLGVVLTVTVIPGVFTIDEDNYLVSVVALRDGRLTVPGTEGLPPTAELAWFDPQAHSRRIEATPVAPTVPPLYAPLALPFSFLGWRALVALNTVAFLLTAALVFSWARRLGATEQDQGGGEAAGWLAVAAFVLGGYSIEYAQGLWPHMIAVALTTTAAYLAYRLRDGAAVGWAFLAGLAAGWATGLRYQNLVLAALVGAGIFLFVRRRWVASLLYAAGAALPLGLCSLVNHARLGFWNPISKGPRYFARGAEALDGNLLHEVAVMFWSRVVDYSQRPALGGIIAAYLQPHPDTGVYVVSGAVKKAWLQSSPWMVVPLLLLALVWLWPRGAGLSTPCLREARAVSFVVVGVLGLFAAAGVSRTDGLSFNQRYFLELVPLMAVVFAWAVAPAVRARRSLALGGAAGLLLAAAALVRPPEAPVRHLALSWLPLLLALLLLGAWWLGRRPGRREILALALSAALGFSLASHLGDDLAASRRLRSANVERLRQIEPHVPRRAALFAFWGGKDALGPLLLDRRRDLVIVDPFADRGAAAERVTDALLADGRPVFLVPPFPDALARRMTAGRPTVAAGPLLRVGEVGGRGETAP